MDPLEPAMAFPYLVCTSAFNNSDWADLYQNLRKAEHRWGMVAKVLPQMVTTVRMWVTLYKTVVKTVLLYGSKIWVVMGEMLKAMEGFHNQVANRIAGKTAWRTVDREWEWPPVADALEISGLWPIKD